MAAWSPNGKGAQLIVQDDRTGKIFYSLCNENDHDPPIFPNDESASFAIDTNLVPKNGSAISGVGWSAPPVTQVRPAFDPFMGFTDKEGQTTKPFSGGDIVLNRTKSDRDVNLDL